MANHTKRTLKKKQQKLFIEHLRQTANVSASCEFAGIASRNTVYNWRDDDELFAEAWSSALNSSLDEIESKLFSRAKEGQSDTAAIFLLKAHRPEKYKERGVIEHTGHIAHDHQHTAVSETDRFITEALAGKTDRTSKKPVSH